MSPERIIEIAERIYDAQHRLHAKATGMDLYVLHGYLKAARVFGDMLYVLTRTPANDPRYALRCDTVERHLRDVEAEANR